MKKIKVVVVSGLSGFSDRFCDVIEKENSSGDIKMTCEKIDVNQLKDKILAEKNIKSPRDLVTFSDIANIYKIFAKELRDRIIYEKPQFVFVGMAICTISYTDFYNNETGNRLVVSILNDLNIGYHQFTGCDISTPVISNLIQKIKAEFEQKMLVRA